MPEKQPQEALCSVLSLTSALINQCAMCIFAYLRHVGDGGNLKADLECATNPQDNDHSKEPLVLYLQK